MIKLLIPEIVRFMLKRLKDAGYQAYIVGGAVRDACLPRPITDWDVTTSATPGEIKTVLQEIKSFALKHDTVTFIDSGHHFEITTFRGTKGCLEDDLSRRDFTIDAMAFDLDKAKVIDPYGGKADIARRLVRAVGDPVARFQEDPLRLLRAVRLAAELGFQIEAKTLKTLSNMASLLRCVASERIREELMKLLMSPRPSKGFNLMVRTGLLRHFFPEILEGYLKRQNACHRFTIFKHIIETVDRVEAIPVLRLTALLHDIAKPRVREKTDGKWQFHGHEEASANLAEEVMRRLRFGRDITQKVMKLIRHHMIDYHSGWSDGAVRRLIRRVGQEQIMDLLVFRRADILAHGLNDQRLNHIDELEARVRNQIKGHSIFGTQDLSIDGHKVMETLGLSPGPEIGNILRNLVERVTDHPEVNNERGLVGILERMKAT